MLGIFLCEPLASLTQASNAAFLISLCVVFTPFAEWWLLRQRLPGPRDVCFCRLVTARRSPAQRGTDQWGWGDADMAAAVRAITVCHHASSCTAAMRPCWPSRRCSRASLGWAAGAGFAGQAPPAAVAHPGQRFLVGLHFTTVAWATAVFAFVAQNWALRHSSPTRVGLLTSSEPAFGALFAVFWLGEQLRVTGWVGGALIVGAALWTMARRGDAQHPDARPPAPRPQHYHFDSCLGR
ncbi:MAG: DMT family transporter [Paenacidovorax caeni]